MLHVEREHVERTLPQRRTVSHLQVHYLKLMLLRHKPQP